MARAFTRGVSFAATLLMVVLTIGGPPAAADTPNACVANPDGGGKFTIEVDFSQFLNAEYGTLKIFDGRVNLTTSYTTHDCGNKSLDDVSGIGAFGTAGGNWFMLDESGGSFKTVPMQIDLGEGFDWVRVNGTPARDTYYANQYNNGGSYPVLNLGDVALIQLLGIEAIFLTGLGGNDWMGYQKGYDPYVQRGGGSFGPFPLPLTINGGAGKDGITGGTANDTLIGAAGNDKLKGLGGKDTLKGGGGDDTCKGGPGNDKEKKCE